MDKRTKKVLSRKRVQRRVRSKIRGTSKKPRLSVFKSNKHIYSQLIDDLNGQTLASASTLEADLRDEIADKEAVEQAKVVGERLGKKAVDAGINQVVFDRNGYRFHGRVKALADGARDSGLDF